MRSLPKVKQMLSKGYWKQQETTACLKKGGWCWDRAGSVTGSSVGHGLRVLA